MDYIDDFELDDLYFDKEHISPVHTQYHCAALDSKDGELCFVDNMTLEYRKEHKFYCLSCGEEMVANLKDDHHRRHFKHKNKTECSCETYLHNLAKKMLAKHFLESEHFCVSYDIKEICPKQNRCKYLTDFCKSQKHERKVDLKEYYQNCEIEKSVVGKDGKRYVADICLLSNNPNVPPMLIEIFVSHACTEDKKNSGLWIMEVPVCSEEDIKNYCSTDTYSEGDGAGIKLFNIKKEQPKELINEQLLRFIHIPNKGSEIRQISCKDTNISIIQESDIELNIIKEPHGFFYFNDVDIIEAIEFELHIESGTENIISHCEDCVHYNPFKGPVGVDNHRCNIDFFRRRPEGLCADFYKKKGEIKIRHEILNQIKLEFVKGSKPKEYYLFIVGPQKFYNSQLIEENCKKRISELANQNLVICGQDRTRACAFTVSVFGFAEDNDIPFRPFVVDWNKNGKSAGYKSNKEIVDIADEFIVFNDPSDKLTQDLIQKAEYKHIPVTLVDFTQVTRNNNICPKCGGMLIKRQGRYGQFWGCFNYPDCDYIG